MPRFLIFLFLLVITVTVFIWSKATSLPDWYEQSIQESSTDPVEELSKIIEKQGFEAFLSGKLSDLLAGKLTLDEDEFNALILTSLAADQSGKELLSVSDSVRSHIDQNKLEIGAVINMEKLRKQNPGINSDVNDLTDRLPFLNQDKVYLAVVGQPVATDGNITFANDIQVKVGDFAIPEFILTMLGVSNAQLKQQSLKLSYLKVKDVSVENGKVGLAVRPSF